MDNVTAYDRFFFNCSIDHALFCVIRCRVSLLDALEGIGHHSLTRDVSSDTLNGGHETLPFQGEPNGDWIEQTSMIAEETAVSEPLEYVVLARCPVSTQPNKRLNKYVHSLYSAGNTQMSLNQRSFEPEREVVA